MIRYPPPNTARPSHQARSRPRMRAAPRIAEPTAVKAERNISPAQISLAFLRAARPMALATMRAIRLRMVKRRMVPPGGCPMPRARSCWIISNPGLTPQNRRKLSCRAAAPESMKMEREGASSVILEDTSPPDEGRLRNWCGEPARKFGPDIATNPRLSPPLAESTHNRLFDPRMSSGAGTQPEDLMEPLYPCCAGLDVHKDSVVACVRRVGK